MMNKKKDIFPTFPTYKKRGEGSLSHFIKNNRHRVSDFRKMCETSEKIDL